MSIAIQQLTGEDLHYLGILAQSQMENDPKFWEIVQRFTVLERLNRKTYNAKALDFSALNKQELETALFTSLACEMCFAKHDMKRLAKFARYLTEQIEGMIYAVN